MQVLIAVSLRVASRWSPGQTAVGEGRGRQSESAKLRGGVWRTRSRSQIVLGGQLASWKRASPPLFMYQGADFPAADIADPARRAKI